MFNTALLTASQQVIDGSSKPGFFKKLENMVATALLAFCIIGLLTICWLMVSPQYAQMLRDFLKFCGFVALVLFVLFSPVLTHPRSR